MFCGRVDVWGGGVALTGFVCGFWVEVRGVAWLRVGVWVRVCVLLREDVGVGSCVA